MTQSRLRRARRLAAADGGFSMIEVMVSALIVILLAGAAAKALIATTHASGSQRVRNQADGLATQDQERLRGVSDEQLNQLSGAGQTRSVVFNGQSFSVTSTATAEDSTGASSCTTNAAAYYKIASTASWTDVYDRQTPSVTEESILARPVSGDLLADVKDQTGAWLSGVSVTAASTGQPTQLGSTDANGCVVFAGLAPASWSVTLTKSGYVDPTGNATPNGSATVATTGMASVPSMVPLYLGPAGSVQATFTTNVTGAGAEADGLSSSGVGTAPVMPTPSLAPAIDIGAPTTAQTSGLLFPFGFTSGGTTSYVGNYTEWGGRCPGQRPPVGTNPVTPTTVTVSPGAANVAATVYEPLLKVSTVTYGGSNVKPSDIEMKYSAGTAPGSCFDTWWASIIGAPAAPPAPAAGWLAYPGQAYAPTGTLTVCADYNVSGTSYRNASVSSLTNTNFGTATVVPAIAITSTSSSGKCNL